jgi:hypothetical protein
MQITRAVFNAIADLLAADVNILAAATAMHVHLCINDFTPSLDTVLADLEFATFNGSAAKSCGTGAQQVFNDVVSGQRVVQLLEPVGGFTWEAAATPAEPETVYGFAVTNTDDDELWGIERLPDPVTISLIGDGLAVGHIRIPFNPAMFS